MLQKQLTVDTTFEDEMAIRRPVTPTSIPKYCAKQDYLLKMIAIAVSITFYAGSMIINWLFSPLWSTTTLIHQMLTCSFYTFVILTTDMDEILNIKHSKDEKLVFCRFISYCDWILAFVEIAEGLLMCLDYFIQHGGIVNQYLLYSSIAKFVLYVYMIRNV